MGLATSEVRRSKFRFALLVGAVGLLGFLILFQQALLGALLTTLRGALVNQDGDVVVLSDSADNNLEASVLTPSQLKAIGAVEGVDSVGRLGDATVTAVVRPRDGSGNATDGDGTVTADVTLWGFEPGRPGTPTTLAKGRLPERAGEGLASTDTADGGYGIGDTVTIKGPTDTEVRIVGLADDVRFAVAPTVLVTWDGYEEAKRALNPAATSVAATAAAVKVAEGADPAGVAEAINRAVGGAEARTTADAVKKLPAVTSLSSTFDAIFGLTYVVVALVIGFFFAILTAQKRESLTLLHALGAPRRWLALRSLGQVVAVLVAGMVLAVLLTVGAVGGMSRSGGLPVRVDPASTATTAAIVMVFGLIAFIPSALRIRRLKVIEAVQRPSLGGLS